jgi:hypothetical protein
VCLSGFERAADDQCEICPPGTYAAGQACYECPPDFVAPEAGSTECVPCPSGASPYTSPAVLCECDPGFACLNASLPECASGGCAACANDTFKAIPGGEACQACPENATAGGAATECVCRAGFATAGDGACLACAPGTYSAVNASCTACPNNTFTPPDLYPWASPAACVACRVCPSGYEAIGSCEGSSDFECVACPANQSSEAGGRCACIPGFSAIGEACQPCPLGTFKSTLDNATCTDCSSGQTTLAEGAASADACAGCEAPSVLVEAVCRCPAGYQRDGAACVPCAPGTSKAAIGDSGLCESCPVDTYSPDPAGTACLPCPNMTTYGATGMDSCYCFPGFNIFDNATGCQPCPTGTFSTAGLLCEPCSACPEDHRLQAACNSTHDAACVPCPNFSNSPPGQTLEVCLYEYQGVCEPCPPGTASSTNANNSLLCEPCPSGTFQEGEAAETCLPCATCPAGQFAGIQCTSTSDTVCQNCTQCALWQHRVRVCNATTDTGCQACSPDFFCDGLEQTPCPLHAVSPANSSSLEDCVCVPGRFEDANGFCAECGPDVYCFEDQRLACPAHSVTQTVLATSLAACRCQRGYYQTNATATSFDCALCGPDDWCFNNSAFDCPDERMTAAAGSGFLSNCTCAAGWYNSDDDTLCLPCPSDAYCTGGHLYNCSSSTYTLGYAEAAEDCLCRPGLYGVGNCTLCPADNWCPGTGAAESCPPDSTSPAGSVSVAACACRVGFAPTGPVSTLTHPGCAPCADGTLKPTAGNTACQYCANCSEWQYESVICTSIQDTRCSPCTPCLHNVTYTYRECTDTTNTECLPCSRCAMPEEYESRPCTVEHNSRCLNSTRDGCQPGFYRQPHASRDSQCEPCVVVYPFTNGLVLHQFTGAGDFNAPLSCPIQCMGASRLRSADNPHLGCVSCEEGNVLWKVFSSNQTHCRFTCRAGYELRDGDCHVAATLLSDELRLDVVNIGQSLDPATGARAFLVSLRHSNSSRFVIAAGPSAPACDRYAIGCCWAGLWRVSSLWQMGRSESAGDLCSPSLVLPATATSTSSLDFLLPLDQLETVAVCAPAAGGRLCTLRLSIIDVIRMRTLVKQVDIALTEAATLIALPAPVQYVPLSAIDVDVLRGFQTPHGIVHIVRLELRGSTEELWVSVRVRHMSKYDPTTTDDKACARFASTRSPLPAEFLLAPGEAVSGLTYWLGSGERVEVFLTLEPTAASSPTAMDVAAIRNVSGLPFACYEAPAAARLEAVGVYVVTGLGADAVHRMQRVRNASLPSTHGELGNLVTLFGVAAYPEVPRVRAHTVLAAYARSPAAAEQASHAAAAVNGSLDFRHDFRAFCLASPDCQYEYVLSNPRLHGFFLLANCSDPEQGRARAWIRASFGAVHDGGHVAALCAHLEGQARAYAAVFMHTLRYLAARGWDHTNDWAARPTETYVWARFAAMG